MCTCFRTEPVDRHPSPDVVQFVTDIRYLMNELNITTEFAVHAYDVIYVATDEEE